MRHITRRGMLGLGAGAAAAVGLAGCGTELGNGFSGDEGSEKDPGSDKGNGKGSADHPIGDGSTAYTGRQPNQPA